MVRRNNILAAVFVAFVLFYLYAPVVVIVLFSFTTSPRLSMPIEGFTLDWYMRALDDPLVVDAFVNSIQIAAVSAIAAGAVGTAFSFGLVGLRKEAIRRSLLAFGLSPAIVPLLVVGIALAVYFRILGVAQGLFNAAIGHVLISLPFVVLNMNARLEKFDFSVLEAARDLGASRTRTFLDVTFPMISASLIGAMLLAAALSFDEFVVTWFNIGNQQTIPVLVWGLMRRGVDPSINAIATFLLAFLVCLVVASNVLTRKGRL